MEQKFEFKQLDIKTEDSWIKRNIWSKNGKRSLMAILIGAIAGTLYFHFTEAQYTIDSLMTDYIKSAVIGGFFGFFITNSPCARGRC